MAKKDVQRKMQTPNLRFPAFKEPWSELPLRDLAVLISDRVGTSECVPYTVTSGVGLVSQDAKLGRTIAGKSLSNYIRLRKDDFAYNKSATKAFPEGYIARYVDDSKAAVPNSIFTCFRANPKKIDPAYLNYLFAGNLHGRWLRKFLTIGARAHGSLNVSDDDLMAMPIPFPSLVEQRKIAACLTSLDEWMVAEGRKLETLRAHKKGLMQQLFPKDSETRPSLRFPDFRDTPGWETRRVDDRGDVLAGKALAAGAPGLQRPYLRTKNVLDGRIDLSDVLTMPMTDAEFGRFELLRGDVLLNEGQSLELVGRTSIYRGEFRKRCAMQNQLLRFRAFPSTCPEFAAQAFRQCQKDGTFASVATKTTSVAHLGSSRFSALELTWPPSLAEQQRIAACLDSLDVLIDTVSQKLHALRDHKNGLMQQLFPSPEEKL